MLTQENELELTKLILMEIGLELDQNENIIDQDTGEILYYDGKPMKFSFRPFCEVNENYSVYFNPMSNYKLMSMMFSYFLEKITMVQGLYFPVFYPTKDEETLKTSLSVKNDNLLISTRFYSNILLAYLELICKINYKDGDFSEFDDV